MEEREAEGEGERERERDLVRSRVPLRYINCAKCPVARFIFACSRCFYATRYELLRKGGEGGGKEEIINRFNNGC